MLVNQPSSTRELISRWWTRIQVFTRGEYYCNYNPPPMIFDDLGKMDKVFSFFLILQFFPIQ